jgi:hypothetical protein
MWINTGSKDCWLGALFFLLILDAIVTILCGLGGKKKSDYYSYANVVDGLILLIVSLGWWFGE